MPDPVKKALTEADIAAMAASGVAPPAVALAATTAPSVAAVSAPAAPAEGAAAAAPAAAAEGAAAPAAATAAAPAAEAAPAAAANTDVTAFLQSQIVAKDAALLTANVEMAGLKAKVTDYEASITGLKEIAASAITNMRVALGGTKTDLSALGAADLLAQHAAAKSDFEKKFVVGGVAAVDATSDNKQANVDPNVSEAEIKRLNRFLA